MVKRLIILLLLASCVSAEYIFDCNENHYLHLVVNIETGEIGSEGYSNTPDELHYEYPQISPLKAWSHTWGDNAKKIVLYPGEYCNKTLGDILREYNHSLQQKEKTIIVSGKGGGGALGYASDAWGSIGEGGGSYLTLTQDDDGFLWVQSTGDGELILDPPLKPSFSYELISLVIQWWKFTFISVIIIIAICWLLYERDLKKIKEIAMERERRCQP